MNHIPKGPYVPLLHVSMRFDMMVCKYLYKHWMKKQTTNYSFVPWSCSVTFINILKYFANIYFISWYKSKSYNATLESFSITTFSCRVLTIQKYHIASCYASLQRMLSPPCFKKKKTITLASIGRKCNILYFQGSFVLTLSSN
jgi:hypothetical protein